MIKTKRETHSEPHPLIFIDLFAATNREHSSLDVSNGGVIGGHGWYEGGFGAKSLLLSFMFSGELWNLLELLCPAALPRTSTLPSSQRVLIRWLNCGGPGVVASVSTHHLLGEGHLK